MPPVTGATDVNRTTTRTTDTDPTPPADRPGATANTAPVRAASTPAANDDFERTNDPAPQVAGAVGGTPAVHARPEAIARDGAARLSNQIEADIAAGRMSRRQAGPVGAVVVDNRTNQTFTGRNTGIPENLHPVLEQRLQNMDPTRMHNSRAGSHAEINALNDALWAREAQNRARGITAPLTARDLNTMTLDTAWTRTNQGGGMVQGQSAPRCANCTQLTRGVQNLAGDATMPYSAERATQAGRTTGPTPTNPNREANAQSMRRGAVVGGAAAAGMSTVRALSDGRITGQEAAGIAVDAGVGVATGTAGGLVERGVARAVDRAAGQAIQQNAGATARVMGGRLAGAGVAGAVVGAGFSAVDQIGAYQRGEVTGSQAVGRVTAEAATGLAAGAAGAAAGAAIGSIIPVAGTVVGGVVGFGVGMAAGYLADRGLRAAGVTDAIAGGVTSAIDAGGRALNSAGETVSGWGRSLAGAFGW